MRPNRLSSKTARTGAAWLTLVLVAAARPTLDGDEPPGPAVQDSSSCARCHSNSSQALAMRDSDGRRIAPFDLWQSTMMANSARDPLWRAVMSAEVAATPSRRDEIEATCLGCHAPMAERVGLEDHDTGSLAHVLDCDSDLGELARDGVSCTVCHGMAPAGLGTEASFSAGFELDEWRRLYGPHRKPFPMPMRAMTGFTPTFGPHVTESSLCASCHTLETEVLEADGNASGASFLEQAPYLEWLNSDFRDEGPEPGPRAASCQDCHAPTNDGEGRPIRTRIARNPAGFDFPPVRAREPFGQHRFVGGNTLVLSLLRDHREELRVEAPAYALQATIDATRDQLENRTARIAIEEVRREGRQLSFFVEVLNLTGHKLPTAHPTRRAWLRIVVRDGQGRVLFASGDTDARGRIVGSGGLPLPSEQAGGPIEPHRDVVRSSDEVATFEAVMADARGEPTHTLVRGASWYVDDRLLPAGWDPDGPAADRTAPVGVEGDADFDPGRDRVRFELEVEANGPLQIEASFLYQPLSARWADEVLRWETPEVEAFRRMYEEADVAPEVLATAAWLEN